MKKRHYFAIASNSGEQFHSFITLSAWLIQQAGGNFDRPQEVCSLTIYRRFFCGGYF